MEEKQPKTVLGNSCTVLEEKQPKIMLGNSCIGRKTTKDYAW